MLTQAVSCSVGVYDKLCISHSIYEIVKEECRKRASLQKASPNFVQRVTHNEQQRYGENGKTCCDPFDGFGSQIAADSHPLYGAESLNCGLDCCSVSCTTETGFYKERDRGPEWPGLGPVRQLINEQ